MAEILLIALFAQNESRLCVVGLFSNSNYMSLPDKRYRVLYCVQETSKIPSLNIIKRFVDLPNYPRTDCHLPIVETEIFVSQLSSKLPDSTALFTCNMDMIS